MLTWLLSCDPAGLIHSPDTPETPHPGLAPKIRKKQRKNNAKTAILVFCRYFFRIFGGQPSLFFFFFVFFFVFFSSSLMGLLAKGSLRKVCGNSAENSRKFAKHAFYCGRKGCGNSAESFLQ